jgi:hypothetical protein
MRALSIRAPWWWFILHAGKDIENRDWPTRFRGTVYLHASKWWNLSGIKTDAEYAAEIARRENRYQGQEITWDKMKSHGGCIVGRVDIIDCVNWSNSAWFQGEYGFQLANPVAFERPIPFKGALGFFDVPDEIVRV